MFLDVEFNSLSERTLASLHIIFDEFAQQIKQMRRGARSQNPAYMMNDEASTASVSLAVGAPSQLESVRGGAGRGRRFVHTFQPEEVFQVFFALLISCWSDAHSCQQLEYIERSVCVAMSSILSAIVGETKRLEYSGGSRIQSLSWYSSLSQALLDVTKELILIHEDVRHFEIVRSIHRIVENARVRFVSVFSCALRCTHTHLC